jgi:hypothetical protein
MLFYSYFKTLVGKEVGRSITAELWQQQQLLPL